MIPKFHIDCVLYLIENNLFGAAVKIHDTLASTPEADIDFHFAIADAWHKAGEYERAKSILDKIPLKSMSRSSRCKELWAQLSGISDSPESIRPPLLPDYNEGSPLQEWHIGVAKAVKISGVCVVEFGNGDEVSKHTMFVDEWERLYGALYGAIAVGIYTDLSVMVTPNR